MKLKKALIEIVFAGALLSIQSHSYTSLKEKEYYFSPLATMSQPNTVCIEFARFKKSEDGQRSKNIEELSKEVFELSRIIEYGEPVYKDKYVLDVKRLGKKGVCFEKSALALQFLRERGYNANLVGVVVYKETNRNNMNILIGHQHAVLFIHLEGKRYIVDPTYEVWFDNGQDFLKFLNRSDPSILLIDFFPFQKVKKPPKLSYLGELEIQHKYEHVERYWIESAQPSNKK
ncbi:MAG: arylamine N-acetyltransferase [Candidatus Anstonellales archaeon]